MEHFDWNRDWRLFHAAQHKAAVEAFRRGMKGDGPAEGLRLLGEQVRETDVHLRRFDLSHVVGLADAELHFLWMDLDQARTYGEFEGVRTDFRERYYSVVPLITALERILGKEGVRRLDASLVTVQDLGSKMGWIP